VSLRPLRSAVAAWTPGARVAADPLHVIAAAWPAIVGEHAAAHCAPRELDGQTLVIVTRSSAWSQQLHFLSEKILSAIKTLPVGQGIVRLTFRTGAVRSIPTPPRRVSVANARTAAGRPFEQQQPPAADAAEALARLRRRFAQMRRSDSGPVCLRCGAALDGSERDDATCAPCGGAERTELALATERLLYLCPWLEPDAVREQIPGLPPGEVERVRRRLLQRWWLVLERARRSGRLSRSGIERSIASSYVLLQSRLPPDRITPAVVRNLVGADLERLLWPGAPP
jgi:hypothetical protein